MVLSTRGEGTVGQQSGAPTQVKAMVPFVAQLAAALDDGSMAKHSRHVMMAGLVDFYKTLQCGGLFLSAQDQLALDTAVYDVIANYAWLAHTHMLAGNVRYNIVQKVHMLAHLPEIARKTINPRFVSTYTEESFVGQGARLYNRVAYHDKQQKAVLSKYLIALQLKYAKLD